MLVDSKPSIELYNSDGSRPELSGNGTRCAAAFLISRGLAENEITLQTGAGPKHLKLLRRNGPEYLFQMNMGSPVFESEPAEFDGLKATILNVGNPQCVVSVKNFDFDWRRLGKEIEHDKRFPNLTNVSFVRGCGAQRNRGAVLGTRCG